MRAAPAFAWQRLLAAGLLAGAPWLASAVTCTAAVAPPSFGVYNPLGATPNDSNGSVTVVCLPVPLAVLQGYTLGLSSGSAGGYSMRRLVSGANTLQYQLYSDASHSLVWGDGSAGTVTVVGSFLLQVVTSVSATHTVYARMPAHQSSAVAGAYADTLLLTISY